MIIRLSPTIRPIDLIGRLDHSRFAILLPGTDESGATAATERLTKAANELLAEIGGHEFGVEAGFKIRELKTETPSPDTALADLIKA